MNRLSGGEAEKRGVDHWQGFPNTPFLVLWFALLHFFKGVPARPAVSNPDFLDHEDGVFKIKLESGFSYPRGHRGHGEEKSPARF